MSPDAWRSRCALACLLTALGLSACADPKERAGSGVVVSGRLVDAETGRPVSRKTIYLHGYHDPKDEQATLDPEDDDTFVLHLSAAPVRLRIFDNSYAYELHEATYEVPDGRLALDVKLVPSHRILLRGRVLFRDGDRLRPVAEGGPEVRKAVLGLSDEKGPVHTFGGCTVGEDGAFALRVPRTALRATVVNTDRVLVPATLDLTGAVGDERQQDFVLEAR